MEALSLPIYNIEGKEVDTVKLDARLFDGTVNTAAIHQAVAAYRANQRKGLASTKTMGEVSGGGRKPWKQKGTGRARAGSTRSPLWRHGGVIFGPHPRDFSYNVAQKIRTLALKSTLNAKVKENNLLVVDDFTLAQPKTKDAAKALLNLKISAKANKKAHPALLLLDKIDGNLKRALNNIEYLSINQAKDVHAYEVLAHRKLIITKKGLEELSKRLKK